MERLQKFEFCHEFLLPYIAEVLNLLHPEKKEAFLRDDTLQVISSDRLANGMQLTFSQPVKSIILINIYEIEKMAENKSHLSKADCYHYTISHEISHYFVGFGETWLLEKEAVDWLRRWSNGYFDDLIQKVDYQAPILEDEGCTDGYSWASGVKKEDLIKYYVPYAKPLDEVGLSQKERIKIIDRFKNVLFNQFKKSKLLEDDKWDESHLNGFSFGVMQRVREIAESHQ